MADPDLICEVTTSGGRFRDWLSVAVTYTYADTDPIRHFSLTTAEPSSLGSLRLVPGARLDVTLAGRTVIKDGFIKIRQAAYDANRHGVQITGLAKAGHIQQASADPGQYRGYTFSNLANMVAKKYGVKFRMENPPPGADKKFPNVIPRWGETDWSLLSRLARMRGILLRADANGDIIGGTPDGGSGAVLEEGRNILSCNCYVEFPWAEKVIGGAQTPGTDEIYGSGAANIQSEAKIRSGAEGLSARIVAEMPLNKTENQTAVDAYAQQILLSTLQCTVVHHGWFKPGTMDLWELGDRVTVKSPMAFATTSGEMDLRVYTVTCAQSEAGTTTTVVLVSEPAFQRRFPDANDGDPYRQSATGAVPMET